MDTYLEIGSIDSNETFTINGSVIHRDLGVSFHVTYYITINLGHVCLNQSLIEDYNNAPNNVDYLNKTGKVIHIPGDTVIGFTDEYPALDYLIRDRAKPQYYSKNGRPANNLVNPYFYFTDDVQEHLKNLYQPTYEEKKDDGYCIESRLNNTIDINRNHTFCGTWWYEDGPFELNESHHKYGWYSFDGCILNILHVNDTNRESFHLEDDEPFTDDMIGVLGDAKYSTPSVEGYDRIGTRYMHHHEGNQTNGILNLTSQQQLPDSSSDYSGEVYFRYEFIENNSTIAWDDRLYTETFSTLDDAQDGFTSQNITYCRGRGHMNYTGYKTM